MSKSHKVKNRNPSQIELVQRRKWSRATIPIGILPIRISLVLFLAVSSLVYIFGMSALLSLSESLFRSLMIGFLNLLAFFFISFQIIIYLRRTSISYFAESGKIVKLDNKVLDTMQGRIIVRSGVFSRKERFYGIEEFDRVTVYQTYFDRFFDIGTVKLIQVDRLENTSNISLPFVKNPRYVARMIQSMIDLEKNNSQTIS